MAKKKTAARKTTRQTATAAESRSNGSKAASLAPSNASSPSPQPLDQAQSGRRKSLPRRSPSQNDTSKGIVFSFRFQNDPALSMAVDIRSYDQQFEFEASEQTTKTTTTTTTTTSFLTTAATVAAVSGLQPAATTRTTEKSLAVSCPMNLSHIDNDDARSLKALCSMSPVGYPPADASLSPSSELRLAGERWSSDPSLYRSNNVFDQSRNLLILHTRKPKAAAATSLSAPSSTGTSAVSTPEDSTYAFHPYRRSMGSSSSSSSSSFSSTSPLPSTPALSQSGSTTSSSSSSSSSPSSSPSSPTPSLNASSAVLHQKQPPQQQQDKEGSCSTESLPEAMELTGSQKTRFLKVRGLGGASGGRRMQVILVS